MTIEYPDYYDEFQCIGGACPDTCCAGWEVDVDEDSYYYYQVAPGAVGERIRRALADDGEGGHYFPLTPDNRCPFLNRANLCDIYTGLGEESLCQVCTEYPRYYMEIGDYEQIDMSLSCPELSRIFFTRKGPIRYRKRQNSTASEEMLSPEDAARLQKVLQEQDALIAAVQGPIKAGPDGTAGGTVHPDLPAVNTVEPICSDERENAGSFQSLQERLAAAGLSDGEPISEFLQVLGEFETINESWTQTLADMRRLSADPDLQHRAVSFVQQEEPLLTDSFTRLSVYLIYRYSIDSYLDGDAGVNDRSRLLVGRSLRLIFLMCLQRYEEQGEHFGLNDMIDVAHRFSKEVEHSDDNVERIKVQ